MMMMMIFDCRCFLFTFIKSSLYVTKTSVRISLAKVNLFHSEKSSRHTDSEEKTSFSVGKNHDTFEELDWTIDD